MTFAYGKVISCFDENLSSDEIHTLQLELPQFKNNFEVAILFVSLIFEFY
jgi:hypothetical protein